MFRDGSRLLQRAPRGLQEASWRSLDRLGPEDPRRPTGGFLEGFYDLLGQGVPQRASEGLQEASRMPPGAVWAESGPGGLQEASRSRPGGLPQCGGPRWAPEVPGTQLRLRPPSIFSKIGHLFVRQNLQKKSGIDVVLAGNAFLFGCICCSCLEMLESIWKPF